MSAPMDSFIAFVRSKEGILSAAQSTSHQKMNSFSFVTNELALARQAASYSSLSSSVWVDLATSEQLDTASKSSHTN